MKKSEYMLKALKAGNYINRSWVFNAFSNSILKEDDKFNYRLYKGDKHYYFIENGEKIELEDTDVNTRPFRFKEKIQLKVGDVPNLKEDVVSDYGILLANYVMFVFPFGDKFNYINGEFDIKKIEKEIFDRLTTDPEYQDKNSRIISNPIYVSEYLKFIDASFSLEGYSQLCITAATERTLTVSPEVIKLRDELLEKYKDSLSEPSVVAMIEAELVKKDKAWLESDSSAGLFYDSGTIDTKRKKTLLMVGYEGGLGVKPKTITKSLAEGWDMTKLPSMINSLRDGSYQRGKGTADGGYATKTINRTMQNINFSNEDCGTKLGWTKYIDKDNFKNFIGFYTITQTGKSELITEENVNKFLNKSIIIRTPQFCKSPDNTFCRYCLGEINSQSPAAISSYASDIGSQLMYINMKAMHGISLKAESYDIVKSIF